MGILFSASDAFEIAIGIERNGARFYRSAAANIAEDSIRHELLELAAMESGHEITFTGLKRDLVDDDGDPWYDPDTDAAQYLENFARGQVFDMTQDPTASLAPQTSLREVIAFALQRERDSVLFFVGLKELMPKAPGRAKVGAIIQQEMAHITLLGKRLAQVAGRA